MPVTTDTAAQQLVRGLIEDIDADLAAMKGGRPEDKYPYQAGCLEYHLLQILEATPKARRNLQEFLDFKKQQREGGR